VSPKFALRIKQEIGLGSTATSLATSLQIGMLVRPILAPISTKQVASPFSLINLRILEIKFGSHSASSKTSKPDKSAVLKKKLGLFAIRFNMDRFHFRGRYLSDITPTFLAILNNSEYPITLQCSYLHTIDGLLIKGKNVVNQFDYYELQLARGPRGVS
jgi:hypothetical protein